MGIVTWEHGKSSAIQLSANRMLRWWRRLEFTSHKILPRESGCPGAATSEAAYIVLCKAPGRKRSHLRSADYPVRHSAQQLMTAGALACGWKRDPALGDGGCKLSKLVAALAVQPPQTQPRDLARPCCDSNYPMHADQAPWWPLQSSPPGAPGPPGTPMHTPEGRVVRHVRLRSAVGPGPRLRPGLYLKIMRQNQRF